jgi:hypothetical protein
MRSAKSVRKTPQPPEQVPLCSDASEVLQSIAAVHPRAKAAVHLFRRPDKLPASNPEKRAKTGAQAKESESGEKPEDKEASPRLSLKVKTMPPRKASLEEPRSAERYLPETAMPLPGENRMSLRKKPDESHISEPRGFQRSMAVLSSATIHMNANGTTTLPTYRRPVG